MKILALVVMKILLYNQNQDKCITCQHQHMKDFSPILKCLSPSSLFRQKRAIQFFWTKKSVDELEVVRPLKSAERPSWPSQQLAGQKNKSSLVWN